MVFFFLYIRETYTLWAEVASWVPGLVEGAWGEFQFLLTRLA